MQSSLVLALAASAAFAALHPRDDPSVVTVTTTAATITTTVPCSNANLTTPTTATPALDVATSYPAANATSVPSYNSTSVPSYNATSSFPTFNSTTTSTPMDIGTISPSSSITSMTSVASSAPTTPMSVTAGSSSLPGASRWLVGATFACVLVAALV